MAGTTTSLLPQVCVVEPVCCGERKAPKLVKNGKGKASLKIEDSHGPILLNWPEHLECR